ncbi:hypothetical protein [Streptomyces sp. NBC_00094]|uniref:hypothetical protein n=1 Tax=Streptomyces sp. NBC_00094 TaxID=2903620 RepID=UPI002257F37F|nr:hypothetical protein [Streptomyces sp. NBC_00094]MCX5394190.1 hypothetical protein [Streptomyces sp. NBC_00094]
MSPASEPTAEPATPAGLRTRPAPDVPRWIVLLLVLAALCGAGAANALPAGAELRTAAPASDLGCETFDPAAAETGLPGRTRRHRTRVRPAPARRRPRTARRRIRAGVPAPVPAPRGDALRRVVMRC